MNITTPIILASNSPRRQELLRSLEVEFEIRVVDIEESWPTDLDPIEVPEYLARLKANALVKQGVDAMIMAADTVVILDGRILGKPQDRSQGLEMLHSLSNKTHQVITGVCLQQQHRITSFHDITEVTFHALGEQEIGHYLDVYQPYDKAGAYGIQEWMGMIGVKSIKGSFYNVMGLPLDKVYQALKQW